jgi:hypothetical protein
MKTKAQFIANSLALLLISLLWAQGAMAQHKHDHANDSSWRIGMVRLTKSAWAGNVYLQSGMYHVKHVVEGDKHWLVFKEVTLRAGYQEGLMWEGKEVARLECRVEPATKSVRNTKTVLARTASGARFIQEIQIAGERVRHILLIIAPAV